ncbi:MAG TPA: hypothetical protein VFJ57_10435 [Solirubrobacterales bacterium]|nr:hypothetical protein [Solirubrobacterales bacterium]
MAGALALVAVVCACAASSAGAVDIIEAQSGNVTDGWQAGTCDLGSDLTCSPSTSAQFFTQAAGHPPVGFTQIIVKHSGAFETPAGDLKTVLVDLPPGLSVNPQATPQCVLVGGKFPPGGCPANTQVGTSIVTASVLGLLPSTLPPFPVYNVAPRPGEPARFGFVLDLGGIGLLNLGEVFLNAGVNWEGNYHEYFTIHVPPVPGGAASILKNRLVFTGTTESTPGGGRFLTNPSTCFNPAIEPFNAGYTTYLHADSQQESAPQDEYDVAAPAPPPAAYVNGSEAVAAPLPPGVKPDGCGSVPFKPSTAVNPNTASTDSPAGATVDVKVPFEPTASIYNSNVREAQVTLPAGMGVNPSAAPALQACTDAQFGKGTRNPIACPAASRIGTVAIDTPVLPAGTLSGPVYLAQQLSRDPASGNLYRIFLDAESAARGLSIRLVANVSANPLTGQLSAVVHEAPQVPFDLVRVTLNGGDKATLTSPPTCGPNPSSHSMVAWSGTPDSGPLDKGFLLTKAPGGGACAKTMAGRPFAPGFDADPKSDQALAYTPFAAHLTRPQGQQELKGIDVHLAPGATAKLAGVPYCSPQEIADAASRAGAAEKKNPSCPDKSQVGVATVQAGTGSSPLEIDGNVYLAGPYKGAPISLAVVTPAVAGPFDLGTVVVRIPVKVDPETAQINPDTEIPDVFGGAKLDIRSIFVNVNRKEFTLNGTNCGKHATAGVLLGGGADPTNPAAWAPAKVSAHYQLNGCKGLKFRPKLKLRLFGATHRAQHPRLRAALNAREGDANIARASVALPHAIFLDQASLGTVCTRPQFAADQCPKRSIYGKARAFTPLLGKPLEGPVVLRSNPSHTLPDMVAHLEGQVDIDLVGVIDSYKGGIRTTFNTVPDVPVKKFVLTLPGGKHGLLVASTNLCKEPPRAIVRIKAQNGKKSNRKQKLRTPCGKKKKKHAGKHQR